MQNHSDSSHQRLPAWALATIAGIIGVGGLGWIVNDVLRRAESMQPASTPSAIVLAAHEGERVKAVVSLHQAEGDIFVADVLDKVDDASYKMAASTLRVKLAADTSVIMGSRGDLKPNAVIQVSGTLDAWRVLRATQIVILTNYVRILPPR